MRGLTAWFERGRGFRPGPRVRPEPDRWWLPENTTAAAQAQGPMPLVLPGVLGDGPRVLVTMDRAPGRVHVDAATLRAVAEAGGVPLLCPPMPADAEAWLELVDAVVLTGGAFDIHPRHYGQAVAGRLDRVDEDRTHLELDLARAALRRGTPLLGLCGGMQAMAVAAGGSLVQDLPDHPTHEQPSDPARPWHIVRVEDAPVPGWGPTLRVNSTHHQAVAEPGEGLRAVGWSPDGVVEAIVGEGAGFALGVQWHPELLGDHRPFAALVGAVG